MKILLAVDDQHFGETIADFAMQNARLPDAEVRVVTVIPSILAYTSMAVLPDLVQEVRDERRRAGTALARNIVHRVKESFPDASVNEFVVEGQPANEILSMAKDWQADLLLVGSHGKHGIEKLLLGSVSQAVVSQAPCPVLVIKSAVKQKEAIEKTRPEEAALKIKT